MSRKICHFTYGTLPPDYADTSRWRAVDEDALQDDERGRFVRLREAIKDYIKTGKLSAISKASGYSEDEIIRQLNRCTEVSSDGQLVGWQALIKFLRVAPYVREAPLPAGPAGAVTGFSGAFSKFLLDHCEITTKLNEVITKNESEDKINESKKSIRQLTKDFAGWCKSAGVREDEYPLNSKSLARKSIERYVREMTRTQRSALEARYGTRAAHRLNVATGEASFPQALAPYDVAGFDAHEEHCIACVVIDGPAGPQAIAIERLWIDCIVDYLSRTILGYCVGIRTEVSSAVIEEAFRFIETPWAPRPLSIPGMTYIEGAGFPCGVIPELLGCFPALLKCDNAQAHLSNRISEKARRRMGCVITYGKLGAWEHNHAVERVFKTLEIYGFQRLPSSTGSNSQDPLRPKNPAAEAVKHVIRWEELIDLTDVILANYNATPNRGLGGQSPLQVLRNHLTLIPSFLPRPLPPPTIGCPEFGIVVETKSVRGNVKEGRRPYIQIDKVHYTSPVLSSSFGLVGRSLRIHIREEDMRVVHAYLESGVELGSLRAQGGWGRTPHTREMRKQINLLCDSKEICLGSGDDPVQKLLEYYASKTYKEGLKRPAAVSRSGTKLANASNVSGLPIPTVKEPRRTETADLEGSPARPLPSSMKIPDWKTLH
ncbi:hypothetical protein AzCIB_1755 [Azoarcus sp. CIB]|uniref:hypothetical protein n=1 Tax=Aromatoleum sp. (strain CIB) TaxID=198107 RepID=UPI0006A2C3A4|nr:hypothetical protein [Azoarcus sp. CIB]AKU11650.1 hypothetical protein AzCIB_1755 [Azoarcus sp. CIB]